MWRFMIDKGHQKKGYGKEALGLILDHVRTLPQAKELKLSCVPGENGPEEFYIRLGFEFTGEIDEGEKIYRIAL